MDAYSDYLRQLAETRIADLRREAAEARLAQSLSDAKAASRTRRGFGLRARLQRRAARRAASGPMPDVVPFHGAPAPADAELRRSA